MLSYFAVWIRVALEARERLAQAPASPADVALVLGNRAWLRGRANPCLTGRVDAALVLAAQGRVRGLMFTGGRDVEDGRIEAEVMRMHAASAGYRGPLALETAASTTRENLAFSLPLLRAAGARSVVLVSEPYHLWRVRRLAQASGFDRAFEVQYAAAPTSCWRDAGMFFRGALREPLAVLHNFAHGHL
ncbi:MAG: YdcF family protein [Comamonadaceae bacterium]|nr:MAG: YdcF family protein [Comamonadaceae bacterium]